jgi:hypothetical protein
MAQNKVKISVSRVPFSQKGTQKIMATSNQTLYAVNNTNNHVSLKNGYVRIEKGSFKPVTQEEITHPDYVFAQDRGWISIVDKLPEAQAKAGKALNVISVVSKPEGMTAEQLKAHQAKAKAADTATSSPIGRPAEEPAVEAEAAEEKAQEAEGTETAKPAAEAKAKATAKAAKADADK